MIEAPSKDQAKPNDDEEQVLMADLTVNRGCWQSFCFFVRQSFKDMGRHKCHFCLSLCSVLIVVLSTLVVKTLTSMGPVIFMSLSQHDSGEIDALFTQKVYVDSGNLDVNVTTSLNYTQAVEVLTQKGIDHHMTPRYEMCPQPYQIEISTDQEQIPNSGQQNLCFKFIDTQQEKEIGVGTSWPFAKLSPNECIVPNKFSSQGVSVGSTIRVQMWLSDIWNNIRFGYNRVAEENGWGEWPYAALNKTELEAHQSIGYTDFTCTVVAMLDKTYGKMPDDEYSTQIIMEYQSYIQLLANATTFNQTMVNDTQTIAHFKDWMGQTPDLAYQYANQFIANMPSPRYEAYQDSNYQVIQDRVLGYLSNIINGIGPYRYSSSINLLTSMQSYATSILLISLIFDVLLIIFVVISCLLIYSLLLISVETKTFETGVMRLIGLSKWGYVSMIAIQAALFVAPSIILGFALSFPCMMAMWSILFPDTMDFRPSIIPSLSASLQALAIGLFIPTLSAIIPIRNALKKSLIDSLSNQRAKLQGVVVTVTDNTSKNRGPSLLFGTVCVVFGISIYYFLPLGLITKKLGLILTIFLVILFGMMTGLTLFATNLQGLLQTMLVHVLFFWEKKSMKILLQKNLIAHKQHNFLTSLIYSLTLACVIFLLVTANLQIQSITAQQEIPSNLERPDLYIWDNFYPNTTDPVLMKYADSIEDFYYISFPFSRYNKDPYYVEVAPMFDNFALYVFANDDLSETSDLFPAAVSPSTLFDDMLSIEWKNETVGLGYSEQLYTARGSQGLGATLKSLDELKGGDFDIADYEDTLALKVYFESFAGYNKKRILWTLDASPWPKAGLGNNLAPTSVPMLWIMVDRAADQTNYNALQIKVKDPSDTATLQAIQADLQESSKNTAFIVDHSAEKSNESIKDMVNLMFSVIIAIMMFLCFFSLSTSMSANLLEQTKEIGVLRSMGVAKIRIKLLYFYEAMIVVFTACILGVLVGTFVGYSMKLQMNLLMDQQSDFYFPWLQLLEIFLLSVLCAFCSTFGPVTRLVRKQIASIFRMA